VTSPLDDLIDRAVAGQVAAFPDPESDRWYGEWQGIFGLTSAPRKEDTYVCAGVVVFSPARLPELIAQWWARCQLIADHPTVAEGAVGPTAQADQDALNAILMSEYPAGTTHYEDIDRFPAASELAYIRGTVTITDRAKLTCTFRGKPCIALHASGAPKPWLTHRGIRRNAYVVLQSDMLTRPGLAVTVPEGDVPFWLAKEPMGRAVLYASDQRTLAGQLMDKAKTKLRG
jgi:hypothetical protein